MPDSATDPGPCNMDPNNPSYSVQTEEFLSRLNQRIQDLCLQRRQQCANISEDAARMMDLITELTQGGKRVRALLAFHSFRLWGGESEDPRILELGASIEFFQAAALIHDDIVDRSDTRRGGPSVHRGFQRIHAENGWGLDPEHFGVSSAILTGDLALAMADESFARISASPNSALRSRFDRMKWEVMAGQYLDIVEEVAAPVVDPNQSVERALKILRFKSAKYSFEHPSTLGALLAHCGAWAEELMARATLPIGEAFQLADDDLGVFGDPSATGKPSGDDLREGKRTVLIALAISQANPSQRALIESILGNEEAEREEIERVKELIESLGARNETLELGDSLARQGIELLENFHTQAEAQATALNDKARQALIDIAIKSVRRAS